MKEVCSHDFTLNNIDLEMNGDSLFQFDSGDSLYGVHDVHQEIMLCSKGKK
jgi:hypothetical protein